MYVHEQLRQGKVGQTLTLEDVPLVCFLVEALVFLMELLCPKVFPDQKVLEDDCEVIEILGSPTPSDGEKESVGEAGKKEEMNREYNREGRLNSKSPLPVKHPVLKLK